MGLYCLSRSYFAGGLQKLKSEVQGSTMSAATDKGVRLCCPRSRLYIENLALNCGFVEPLWM